MGTTTPLAIGTRGTVGSLVRREIEYFRRLDVDSPSSAAAPSSSKKQEQDSRNCYSNSSNRHSSRTRNSNGGGNSTSSLGQLLMSWSWKSNKKKRRSNVSNGSNRFMVPNMCAAVEVISESKRFRYQNLKDDHFESFMVFN